MHDSGPVQILIILHVLCVVPGNKSSALTAHAHENSMNNTLLLFPFNTWQLIACSTGIYAIIFKPPLCINKLCEINIMLEDHNSLHFVHQLSLCVFTYLPLAAMAISATCELLVVL